MSLVTIIKLEGLALPDVFVVTVRTGSPLVRLCHS
jgi:hypothetical protein